jgi:sterol desaturase/sphingolipid hydroxylase (fatty acid hydroxylase superfamily)
VLWAAHAVHHQSEDYNLSTALRQTSTGFIFGWIFYLPLFVIGFPIEVLITVNAVNLIYQFWVHTQVIRRMGVLDRILVTPSNHRVHHGQNDRYIDKNYLRRPQAAGQLEPLLGEPAGLRLPAVRCAANPALAR